MRASILLSVPFCIAFSCLPAIAQATATGAVRTRIQGIEVPPIPNAPFTAKEVVTWNQPLVGGGTISKKYYTLIARDSQGRIHRETRGFVPGDSSDEPPLRTMTILDPVTGTRTSCTEATGTCATGAYHPRIQLPQQNGNGANVRRESLGSQTIDELPVTGTRETVTNTAGTGGSKRLALTHTDSWYSSDLQMDLRVNRSNPLTGDVTLSVTDLVRGEPDRSWFTVPPGYEIRTTGGAQAVQSR